MTSIISRAHRIGTEKLIKEHDAKEGTKVGTLRVGNTGVLLPDGRVLGKCGRLSYLRFKGIAIEGADPGRQLMFDAGLTNEDIWAEKLKRGLEDGYTILREEEIPVSWMLKITGSEEEVQVTGRPDIVILKNALPVVGLELKLVSSMWTARDVGFEMSPKMPHLLQTGHYSWQLGIPFELWYTSRADFAVNGWAQKHFPKQGGPGSTHCEYNDKGEIKKVLPFVQGYQVQWLIDSLCWRPIIEDTAGIGDFPWTDTGIKTEDIRRYYESVLAMDGKDGKLLPPPSNIEATGKTANFKACDYCELNSTCNGEKNKYTNTQEWLAAVVAVNQVKR